MDDCKSKLMIMSDYTPISDTNNTLSNANKTTAKYISTSRKNTCTLSMHRLFSFRKQTGDDYKKSSQTLKPATKKKQIIKSKNNQ